MNIEAKNLARSGIEEINAIVDGYWDEFEKDQRASHEVPPSKASILDHPAKLLVTGGFAVLFGGGMLAATGDIKIGIAFAVVSAVGGFISGAAIDG